MEETFPQKIYQLVKTIPSGKVATYGQLALLAGSPRASRIVGAALAKAPAGLPCHRVLYRDGSRPLVEKRCSGGCWKRRASCFFRTDG